MKGDIYNAFGDLISVETKKEYNYTHSKEGIAYFEGGWWMHEYDRAEMNQNRLLNRKGIKANHETKQIEIDHTIYPKSL